MKLLTFAYELAWRLLLLLFLYTALDKVADFSGFTQKLAAQPFDPRLVPFLSIAIPGVEFIACGLLIAVQTRVYGLITSVLLMIAFTVYVALAVFNVFDRVPCSCSAIHEHFSWTQHLYINITFLALAVYGTWFQIKYGPGNGSSDNWAKNNNPISYNEIGNP
jgi:putative oxidoreductase